MIAMQLPRPGPDALLATGLQHQRLQRAQRQQRIGAPRGAQRRYCPRRPLLLCRLSRPCRRGLLRGEALDAQRDLNLFNRNQPAVQRDTRYLYTGPGFFGPGVGAARRVSPCLRVPPIRVDFPAAQNMYDLTWDSTLLTVAQDRNREESSLRGPLYLIIIRYVAAHVELDALRSGLLRDLKYSVCRKPIGVALTTGVTDKPRDFFKNNCRLAPLKRRGRSAGFESTGFADRAAPGFSGILLDCSVLLASHCLCRFGCENLRSTAQESARRW